MLFLTAAFPFKALSKYQDSIERTFMVHEGGTLDIKSCLGSISVTTSTKETVEITVNREVDTNNSSLAKEVLEDLEIKMEKQRDDVYIEIDYKNKDRNFFSLFSNKRRRLRLKIEVVIPEKYNVDLKTSGGSITVEDLDGYANGRTSGGSIELESVNGPVNASTSGGRIRLVNANGDVDLRSSGGGITTENISGDVNAHTSGGRIKIGDVTGSIEAHTSGGGIEIGEVAGNIDATTSGGSLTAYLSNQITENCRLTSSGGSIYLYINPECRFSINAQTSGGGVKTDFPVTLTGVLKKNRLNADINGGGHKIYLRTSGGSINLKK